MRGIKADVWNADKPNPGYSKTGGYETIYVKDLKSLIRYIDDGDCATCPVLWTLASFIIGFIVGVNL